jgi:lipopolysaccharide/colanic/teichoic acid biosynthesis glycosyltransferase
MLDIAIAALALVLLSPVLAAVALAVRLTSPGKALLRQSRVGQGREPFSMYKFRTMYGAADGPEITLRHDPRVTPVGRHLRNTGLDELPQLVNVLLGDMTLVGPRPETPSLADRYPHSCQGVFDFRPGLTGPVQIGLREEDPMPAHVDDPERFYLDELVPRRTALDWEYLSDPSLRRTLVLLVETARYLVRS